MNQDLIHIICRLVDELDDTTALDSQKRKQLTEDLADFVLVAAAKYIRGQREHGGDIHDRDLFKELDSEIIDQFFYSRAAKRKHS